MRRSATEALQTDSSKHTTLRAIEAIVASQACRSMSRDLGLLHPVPELANKSRNRLVVCTTPVVHVYSRTQPAAPTPHAIHQLRRCVLATAYVG